MHLKVLSTFLAIQIVTFALWQGVHAWKKDDPKPVYAAKIQETIISHEAADYDFDNLLFAAKSKDEGYQLLKSAKKEEMVDILEKLPVGHTSTLKNIILDYDPTAHRGLGGKNAIILRGVNIDREEFVSVLVHEIGHATDLGWLSENDKSHASEFKDGSKPVYADDPSLDFYRISWSDEKTRKKDANNMDFVSGYSMTDPFEDFAECYVYYVLHNKEFKSKTQTSDKLLAKYHFMKNTVFNGEEFDTGEYLTDNLKRRPWDITILSYDLNTFLAS